MPVSIPGFPFCWGMMRSEVKEEMTMGHDAFDATEPDGDEPDGDEPEGIELPTTDNTKPTYKLTIEGLTEQDIVNVAVRRLSEKLEAAFTQNHQKQISDAISIAVTKAVERIVESKLDAQINKIIEDGWEERGKWGEETGKRFSLAQKVTEFLREKIDVHGRNQYDGQPRASHLMRKAVEEVFASELKSEIDGAKATVKKMIDEQVMAVLAKTLKQALGLER